MAEVMREVEETTVSNTAAPVVTGTVPAQATSTVATARTTSGVPTAERIVYFITGILMVLLAFRFVLSLLGANRNNGFGNFIYSVSYPFVAPFFGLFGYNVSYGVSRFEIETVVAMVVYALVGYGITKIIRIAHKTA